MYEKVVGEIASEIRPTESGPPLIAVDGPGGSGKSTLAGELAESLTAEVVPMDDFYRPSSERDREPGVGEQFDWRRLEAQVLAPASRGHRVRYQRYDWPSDQLDGWRDVPLDTPLVVEGVYVLRNELADYYSYRVWVDTPPDVRLRRGLNRDGEEARDEWTDWMRREDEYIAQHHPERRADKIIEGAEEGSIGSV